MTERTVLEWAPKGKPGVAAASDDVEELAVLVDVAKVLEARDDVVEAGLVVVGTGVDEAAALVLVVEGEDELDCEADEVLGFAVLELLVGVDELLKRELDEVGEEVATVLEAGSAAVVRALVVVSDEELDVRALETDGLAFAALLEGAELLTAGLLEADAPAFATLVDGVELLTVRLEAAADDTADELVTDGDPLDEPLPELEVVDAVEVLAVDGSELLDEALPELIADDEGAADDETAPAEDAPDTAPEPPVAGVACAVPLVAEALTLPDAEDVLETVVVGLELAGTELDKPLDTPLAVAPAEDAVDELEEVPAVA
ncbi:hypothetical protein BAUCODRAFT_150917 [Baudoinia panamericana UAMH 10762]|uniref:Uncharacterized protein n=1 Tax=Baudoinia panamericana (strain UAMH 10762) TaxID=717646 RepID=M2N4I4_BAUPA|nr:uncharacterized protein BAUCODRAFT_150917 [Baudoinia panamericana UAMH 10762]EMC93625.1 hypothetical protein BAUCODRAFT_150917 [Baudoinia panamericana UAMH 10762]